jgi:hypothetical protein
LGRLKLITDLIEASRSPDVDDNSDNASS